MASTEEYRGVWIESLATLYVRAALAGVIAGVAFGLVIQFGLERMTTIGALYTLGQPSLVVGWLTHLLHSILFAGLFATIVRSKWIREYVEGVPATAVAGVAFGALLWFVNIGFVWPTWLNAVAFADLPVPYFAPRPLVGHLLWGGIAGAVFPLLGGRG